jgi:hypothetical protein
LYGRQVVDVRIENPILNSAFAEPTAITSSATRA